MKILYLTLANTVLAGSQSSFAAPSSSIPSTQFQQVSTSVPYQQYQPSSFGGGFGGSFAGPTSYGQFGGSTLGQPQLLGVSYSPYNKPGQSGSWSKGASSWDSPAASSWTPATAPTAAPAAAPAQNTVAVKGAGPRPPNPALSGRSPSEQLQITKCRSAQSCEKCRQLNCYWDVNSKVTNRCIALGLESTQIPVEAGQASNLGYCPTSGQTGFVGVNWLAIEASGAPVPNLEGMTDVDVQKWLSSLQGYNPDATNVNYPAGDAFRELLPSASSAYAAGKIPSTTPWVSFFDSNLNGGSYNYDGYYEGGYSYDLPSGHFTGSDFPSGQFSGSFTGSFSGSTGWNDMGGVSPFYDASAGFNSGLSSFNSGLPSFPATGGFNTVGGFGNALPLGSSLSAPSFSGSFVGSTTGFPSTSTIGPYSSLPVAGSLPGMPLASGFNSFPPISGVASFSPSSSTVGFQG